MTAGGEKEKETYCFKCGETSHKYTECSKKDLKCKAHPNSMSHADLACFYYRKAMGLPINTRPRQDGSKDSTRSGPTPPPGNGSQNLVIAEINNDVDSTEIYTSNEESHGAHTAQISDDSESVDGQEYYSDN